MVLEHGFSSSLGCSQSTAESVSHLALVSTKNKCSCIYSFDRSPAFYALLRIAPSKQDGAIIKTCPQIAQLCMNMYEYYILGININWKYRVYVLGPQEEEVNSNLGASVKDVEGAGFG